MDDIDILIKGLIELDYSKNPYQEVKSALEKLGNIALMSYKLHPNKLLTRARPNIGKTSFTKISDLTFNPQENNTTYKRASTPLKTMFYGAIEPNSNNPKNITTITAAMEGSELLRHPENEGIQQITFGRWVVKKDIQLVVICYDETLTETTPEYKELYDAYIEFIKELPEDLRMKTTRINNFLSNEFSKKVRNHFDYLISAVFTEILLNKGFSGVVYPSTQMDFKGFNIAISPECVNECLELKAVLECKIYKKGAEIVLDNESFTKINSGQKEFILEQLPYPKRLGPKKVIGSFKKNWVDY